MKKPPKIGRPRKSENPLANVNLRVDSRTVLLLKLWAMRQGDDMTGRVEYLFSRQFKPGFIADLLADLEHATVAANGKPIDRAKLDDLLKEWGDDSPNAREG